MDKNKGRRKDLENSKYKKRLKKINQKEGHYYLKHTSTPCSCVYCRSEKYSRSKNKNRPNDDE
jgi:hypothetical protein